MYTTTNFKTKKAVKDALKAGQEVTCYSPGPFPCPRDGEIDLEGPHFPQPHTWYATGVMKDGKLISIK